LLPPSGDGGRGFVRPPVELCETGNAGSRVAADTLAEAFYLPLERRLAGLLPQPDVQFEAFDPTWGCTAISASMLAPYL
jgi:hypothetical protein